MSARVLVFFTDPNWGGPHNRMLQIWQNLAAGGYEIIAVLPDEPGSAEEYYLKAGIKIHKIRVHRLRRYKSIFNNIFGNLRNLCKMTGDIKNLRKIMREEAVDIVQISGVMAIQAGVAAWGEKRPIVWQILGLVTPRLLKLLYMPFIVASSSVIMSVGRSVAARHYLVNSCARRLIYFLPPVDTARFEFREKDRKMMREALGLLAYDYCIGTVGNRNYAKGHDYIVRIAELCRDRGLPFKFIVVGRDTSGSVDYYRNQVIQLAEKKGLVQEGIVRFIEPKEPIERYFGALDAFALTSRIEGTPTVLLEAMATSLPIVTHDVGSVAEVVGKESGFIVKIGDIRRFCDLLEELWANPALAQKRGASAREEVERVSGVDLCAQKHIRAYQHALGEKRN